jgi:hypothetical protein
MAHPSTSANPPLRRHERRPLRPPLLFEPENRPHYADISSHSINPRAQGSHSPQDDAGVSHWDEDGRTTANEPAKQSIGVQRPDDVSPVARPSSLPYPSAAHAQQRPECDTTASVLSPSSPAVPNEGVRSSPPRQPVPQGSSWRQPAPPDPQIPAPNESFFRPDPAADCAVAKARECRRLALNMLMVSPRALTPQPAV